MVSYNQPKLKFVLIFCTDLIFPKSYFIVGITSNKLLTSRISGLRSNAPIETKPKPQIIEMKHFSFIKLKTNSTKCF